MRVLLAILALAPSAQAQTPQQSKAEKPPAVSGFAAPGEPLTLDEVQRLPPDAIMSVLIEPGAVRLMNPAEIQEQLRQGKSVRPMNSRPPSCPVDYSEIAAEQKASDAHLRVMKRREEIIPLQHQYEQELYYWDRNARLYQKTCGKSTDPSLMHDMTKKACDAIAGDCKPVKHW